MKHKTIKTGSSNARFTHLATIAGATIAIRKHAWVTVINPHNQRSLLQACDDCGVVKSENSLSRNCLAPRGQGIISGSLHIEGLMAI